VKGKRLTDAREQHVEEIELLLMLGSRLASLYENSDPSRKRLLSNWRLRTVH